MDAFAVPPSEKLGDAGAVGITEPVEETVSEPLSVIDAAEPVAALELAVVVGSGRRVAVPAAVLETMGRPDPAGISWILLPPV